MLIDVSQQKEAVRHRRILIGELNRRVKNTLAIVQGVARMKRRDIAS
jgi:two-component sensor histidine kinase